MGGQPDFPEIEAKKGCSGRPSEAKPPLPEAAAIAVLDVMEEERLPWKTPMLKISHPRSFRKT